MAAASLACPVCGDPAQTMPTSRVLVCSACSAALYVEDPPTPHVMVEPAIDAARATSAVKSWMHGVRHRELLAARAHLEAPRLVYLPFARVEATVLGTLYGRRKHVEDKRTYYTDEEVAIGEASDTIEPLSAVGELGVERLLPLADVPHVAFDEAAIAARNAELVPALETEGTATDRAHASFLAKAHKNKDLETITGEALTVIGARETTVHYPFWRVDYRAGRLSYVAVVDARTGEVAYGRAPGSTLFHAAYWAVTMPIAAVLVLVGAIVAIEIFRAASAVDDLSSKLAGAIFCVGAVVGGAIALAGVWLAKTGHRGLRQAGEIESGYGAHRGAELLELDDDDYEKARASERETVEKDKALLELEGAP